jgi:beta-xylosidase
VRSPKAFSQTKPAAASVNFDKDGHQVTRFSTVGDAIDAHDGEIALFNGTYYLYGTSYDCGFAWGDKKAPFCGFKSYSSTDMVNWTDRGFLFDAQTPVWQTRCNGNTYGCFRPHVIFNEKTKLYVLWINVYDNVSGYRVFTAKQPTGPFTEVAEPKLAVNSNMPAAGLNNGDHDTFIDDDGTAYLAYTDWRTKGSIIVEKLSADYLTGTGEYVGWHYQRINRSTGHV